MQITPTIEALAGEAWRSRLDTYAQVASRSAPGRPWDPHRWSKWLARELQRDLLKADARIIVSVPPQHGKSELCSVWLPTWWLDVINPAARIALASYEAEVASGWGARVRDNLRYGGRSQTKIRTDSTARNSWKTKAGGGMVTTGIGGPLTGKGADIIIVDDPVKNDQEASSPTIRERHKTWFDSVAMTRLQPGGSVIVVMTRWNEEDLAGHLEKRGGWRVIRIPAIAEKDDPIGREEGEALCPERYPLDVLLQRRDGDPGTEAAGIHPRIWAGLYQQRPPSATGDVFLRDWLADRYTMLPSHGLTWLISVDATFKGTKKNDFVVAQVWAGVGAMRYLVDQIRGQWTFSETLVHLRALCARYPQVRAVLIEEAANGSAIIDVLRKEIAGVIAIQANESKIARAESIATMYRAGQVLLPAGVGWVDGFVEEHAAFPSGANDDQVDAGSQALREWPSSVKTGAIKERMQAAANNPRPPREQRHKRIT